MLRKILAFYFLFFLCLLGKAQLSGTFFVPSATYTTLASVISDLNIQGVNGPVTVNISAGYTETAPIGGYTFSATGTTLNPIIFQKTGIGANPLISAYSGGTAVASSALQDGVWRFIGSDFITLDGIDIIDPNNSNPATMEFGYGFFKASAADGCQNNLVKNCSITLKRINNSTGNSFLANGSRGIEVINAFYNAHMNPLTITVTAGSNSNNRFYNNYISNCNVGFSVSGFQDALPYTLSDQNNDIGGVSALTGNTIVNYGGGGSNPSMAVFSLAQYFFNVSNNLINNNNGLGINHPGPLKGIYLNGATGADASVNNNTITLHGGGTTAPILSIHNVAAATSVSNSVSISNNLIKNCTYSTATTSDFYGIYNNGGSASLAINGNTLTENSTAATAGSFWGIINSGVMLNSCEINNNSINNTSLSVSNSTTIDFILNNNAGINSTVSISSNTIQTIIPNSHCHLIWNATSGGNFTSINNNVFSAQILAGGYNAYCIRNQAAGQNLISGNTFSGPMSKGGWGSFFGYYTGYATPAVSTTITNNNFSNVNLTGGVDFTAIHHAGPTTLASVISSNTISNISNSGGSTSAITYTFGTAANLINNNLIQNLTSSGTLTGVITFGSSNTASLTVSSNTINGLSISSASLNRAISCSGGNFYCLRNKIYNNSSTNINATVQGIGAFSNYSMISNNIIGDLTAPNSNGQYSIDGIILISPTAVLCYNTIRLNATGIGSNLGTTCITSYSPTTLTLRNNILINLSVPNGTGKVSCITTNASGLGFYSTSSNNNIFFAGPPAPNHIIFTNGTNALTTMPAFTAFASPRESSSFTENTPFQSLVGSSSSYLHINPSAVSVAESGAVNIAGITSDFDTDIRQGNVGYSGTGTAPDIGADENNQNAIPCSGMPLVGSITPSSVAVCPGSMVSLSAMNYPLGAGISFQWQQSTSPAGPFVNVTGGSGATSPVYTTPSLLPGPLYYILAVTCSNSGSTAISPQGSVFVSQSPTITVNSGSICSGNSFTIIANGANTYTFQGGNSIVSPTTNSSYTVTGTSTAGCISSNTATSNVTVNATPTITVNSGSICSGNSFTMAPSGANSYTFQGGTAVVSPTISNSYTVTGTSTAGCVSSNVAMSNVTVNTTPTISVNSGSICPGNSFTIIPSGANTYTIQGGSAIVSPTINNSYTITGTSTAGCVSSNATISNVIVNATPTISVNSGSICFGNSFTITPSGATTYTIQGGSAVVSPSVNTSYSVTGTGANGCIALTFAISNVTVSPTPTITVNSGSICSGDSFTMIPNGANTYTYSGGSAIVSPTLNTFYTVIGASTSGCSSSTPAICSVYVNPLPVINVTTNDTLICNGETATLTANGALTYSWSSGGTNATEVVSPTVTTNYTITTVDVNGCQNTAVITQSVDACAAIIKNSISGNELSIYPNPFNSKVTIISSGSKQRLQVLSVLGAVIFDSFIENKTTEIDLSAYSNGIYYIKISSFYRKIIKE